MACYSPIRGWLARTVNPSGKRPVVFNKSDGFVDLEVQVPCGKCIGCRLDRTKSWAIRCYHESLLFENNSFITLTYEIEPENGSLNKRDFVLFMKRLRKKVGKVRFFHAGEYGELLGRPHHHACIFGYDFPDKYLWSNGNGINIYRSPILEELWEFGFSTVGEVTFDSIAYTARYILKKNLNKTGNYDKDGFYHESQSEHYGKKIPEYVTMSRNPGIGKDFYKKYKGDLYNADVVMLGNKFMGKPPKYYDKLFDIDEPVKYAKIKYKRKQWGKNSPDNTLDRLEVREECTKQAVKRKARNYEN